MTQPEAPSASREPMTTEIRKAAKPDCPALTAVMARAFDDDPFANWACAQDARRSRRIYDFMSFALEKLTFPHGDVYTTGDIQGGAFWTPPGKWKLGLLQQLLALPDFARSTGWRRIPTVISGINGVEKKHPKQPHYYLLALGVEPELQGRSIGTQLMRPVLERCDHEGIPAYLESSKERNVPLYERNGFRVTEEIVLPKGGPKLWLMWRDPQ
ncbi:MAG: GNAT family N-acetyltransferase [Hyphomicrobiales bacterium]